MERSFVISLALVAGCWDQPELLLDVQREDATENVIVSVCEPDNTRCDHNDAFPVGDGSMMRNVSIITKSPAILLWLQNTQMYCIDLSLGSHELDCGVMVHASSVDWLATTPACGAPSSSCPPGGPAI